MSVNLSVRTDIDELVQTPEVLMQQMSLKLFARRQALLAEYVGKKVSYIAKGGKKRTATLQRVDEKDVAHLTDGGQTLHMSVRKLFFD